MWIYQPAARALLTATRLFSTASASSSSISRVSSQPMLEELAGTYEVFSGDIVIGERAQSRSALFGGNSGGETGAVVYRYCESRLHWRIVVGNHAAQVQTPGVIVGDRRADDAAGVANDERHLLGGGA